MPPKNPDVVADLMPDRLGLGRIHVSARVGNGKFQDIAVFYDRPSISSLWVGCPPSLVRERIAVLFSLCRQAQVAAAESALGLPSSVSDTALWQEMLGEHFWRLCLDWPLHCGLSADRAAFANWYKNTRPADPALFKSQSRSFFDGQREKLEKILGGFLTASGEIAIAAAVSARWQSAENTLKALMDDQPYPRRTENLEDGKKAFCATARGELRHQALLKKGLVMNYVMDAPTDRLFSSNLALKALLPDVVDHDAKKILARAVLALDPCFPCDINIQEN